MLNLMPPLRRVHRLFERWRDRYWLATGRVQTWADGSPIFVHCTCGSAAVIVTEYIGGKGAVDQMRCLTDPAHTRDLTFSEQRFIGDAQRAEAQHQPASEMMFRIPEHNSVYSPIAIL